MNRPGAWEWATPDPITPQMSKKLHDAVNSYSHSCKAKRESTGWLPIPNIPNGLATDLLAINNKLDAIMKALNIKA
jgi:hypothetical protein